MAENQTPLYLWRIAVRYIYGKVLAMRPPKAMRESTKRGWLFYRERIERMAHADAAENVSTSITMASDGRIRVQLIGPGRVIDLEPHVDFNLEPMTRQIELVKSADELWEEKT